MRRSSAITTLAEFAGPRRSRLLADMVARPSLTEADFARVRQLRLHRLTQLRDVPGAVADRTFMRLLYGSHPYGHTPMGTEQSVATLTVDDVRAFHAEAIRPDAATLIAVGDCDHAEIERLAADAFDGWGSATARGVDAGAAADRSLAHAGSRRPGWSSCRGRARRSRSCASVTSRSRATRPTTMRSSPPTWCSAVSSSAAST